MTSAVDIITLENFEVRMPRWDPSESNHLYALVDMGRCVCPRTYYSRWICIPDDS